MTLEWVKQWMRADAEAARLQAENDDLRAQVESQSRLIADCVEFQRRMKDEAQRVGNIALIFREWLDQMREIELRLCDISTVVDGKKVRP